MKYFLTVILLLVLVGSCKPKEISGVQLENKLIETMKNYLDTTLQPSVTVVIKNVSYFPEKERKLYDCEFQVNMRSGEKDTMGTVAATISNDFLKVIRTR